MTRSELEQRLERLLPGTRIASIVVGAFFAAWYALEPPRRADPTWPGVAGTLIATLLVALAVSEPFTAKKMDRPDALAAAIVLLMSVVSLLLAIRNAARGDEFSIPLGAIVIGSMSALGWLTLTGVFDALIRKALTGRDPTPSRPRDASGPPAAKS